MHANVWLSIKYTQTCFGGYMLSRSVKREELSFVISLFNKEPFIKSL